MVTRRLEHTVAMITLEWINWANIKRVPMVNNEWRAICPYNPICGKRIIGKKLRDSANPYNKDHLYSFIKIRCNKISTKRDTSGNIIGYWRYPTITYIRLINDIFDIAIYVEICKRQQWTWYISLSLKRNMKNIDKGKLQFVNLRFLNFEANYSTS